MAQRKLQCQTKTELSEDNVTGNSK